MMKINIPSNSTFLITGGAGFIGSNLCEKILEYGYNVVCLDNLSTGFIKNIETFMENEKFKFIKGDIRNLDDCIHATKGIDFVLHQAAWGSVPRSIEYPLIYEEINIKGTLNMLEASRVNRVKKFVYASSSSVYGDDPRLPKVEGREGKLLSPYALTKKVNEEYARLYQKLYGLDTYGLRYFNVFGKRQDPNGAYAAVIPKFISQLLKGENPKINGDGLQSRDFTFIDNVVQANLKACMADSSSAGESYNIAYGGQIKLIDVFRKISTLLGKNIEPIYGPDREGDIKHSNADISKAKNLLSYDPKYDFDYGISSSIAWYKDIFSSQNDYSKPNEDISIEE